MFGSEHANCSGLVTSICNDLIIYLRSFNLVFSRCSSHFCNGGAVTATASGRLDFASAFLRDFFGEVDVQMVFIDNGVADRIEKVR
jgi:hypothetical protein